MNPAMLDFEGLLARFRLLIKPSRGAVVPGADASTHRPGVGFPISQFVWEDEDPTAPVPPPPPLPLVPPPPPSSRRHQEARGGCGPRGQEIEKKKK